MADTAQSPTPDGLFWHKPRWAMALVVVLLVVAYANTFSSPFVLDDEPSIVENKTIRDLWQPWDLLNPPPGSTTEGRPVANLTFAVSYALGGLDVTAHRLMNLLIHVCAGLFLFGIIWRTLTLAGKFRGEEQWAALVVAALWSLHPIQTESVTYIIQRVESLMGLFYFFTLYAFIRACEGEQRGRLWKTLAVISCWLGMGTKEVMVSAPLIVLLYDRTVIVGTFAAALKKRPLFYASLFASWAMLAWLLSSSFGRNDTAGFGSGVSSWHYLLTQCQAITTYLRLSVWPAGLTFDYGRPLVKEVWAVLPQAIFLLVLFALTFMEVLRRSLLGLAGAWFFATLAPSSSIVPVVTQTMTEHRMYLASLAVIVALVALAYRFAGKAGLIFLGLLAPVLACVTYQRNSLYDYPIGLWQDTVNKMPGSARARSNLGYLLAMDGRPDEALPHFEAAINNGDYIDADLYANYGYALNALGRFDEAETALGKALTLNPHHGRTFAQRGNIAMKRGQMEKAVEFFQQALRYAPGYLTAQTNLGAAWVNLGEMNKAKQAFENALEIDRDCSRAWTGLAAIEARNGHLEEAEKLCRRALIVASTPDEIEARLQLGGILAMQQRLDEAKVEFIRVSNLNPKRIDSYRNLALLLAQQGRYSDAIVWFEHVRRETPHDAQLIGSLGMAYELSGNLQKAEDCYRESLRLDEAHPFARERMEKLKNTSAVR